ncbi:MAG: hypothetical protein AB7S26_21985 [Sandaracinaceae bacterium]
MGVLVIAAEEELRWSEQIGIEDRLLVTEFRPAGAHFSVGWSRIEQVRADVWPDVTLHLASGSTMRIRADAESAASHISLTERLFTQLAQRSSAELVRGWLDLPDETPEQVGRWPESGGSAYRGGDEPILASREGMSRSWFARVLSSAPRGIVMTPTRVVLTERYVYFDAGQGVQRVLRADVRRPIRRYPERVYPIQQRRFLRIPFERGCRLLAILDGPAG